MRRKWGEKIVDFLNKFENTCKWNWCVCGGCVLVHVSVCVCVMGDNFLVSVYLFVRKCVGRAKGGEAKNGEEGCA